MKIIFIHIAKNGGRSVSEFLRKNIGAPEAYPRLQEDRGWWFQGQGHATYFRAQDLFPEESKNWFAFTTIRNPVDRAYSAWRAFNTMGKIVRPFNEYLDFVENVEYKGTDNTGNKFTVIKSSSPNADDPATPVTAIFAVPVTVSSPKVEVDAVAVTPVTASPVTISLPSADAKPVCVTATKALATTTSSPNAEVLVKPVVAIATFITTVSSPTPWPPQFPPRRRQVPALDRQVRREEQPR